MKDRQTVITTSVFIGAGALMVLWVALKIAPGVEAGIPGMITALQTAGEHPFSFRLVPKTGETMFLFLMLYATAIGVYITSITRFRRGEEYGSAKWGSVSSAASKYTDKRKGHEKKNLILTRHMAIGTEQDIMFRHQRNLNTVVIGGSGSQKTRSHVLPNLLQASNSFVVLDPSGEILRATGTFLEGQGYKIKVLNLFEPDKSQRYNPFVYLKNDDDVDRMVENFWKATTVKDAIKGDQFWDDTAKELLLALCYYLYYEAPVQNQNFSTVHYMVRNMAVSEESKEPNDIDELFDNLEKKKPDHIAIRHYRAYHSGAAKTLQSIQITLFSRLGKFNLDSIEKLSTTTEDDLGLFSIPEEKSVLFAITPVADTSLNFFVSMLYGQLLDIVYRYGGEHGRLKVPLHLLMDEFANITLPRDFEKYLATFRKFGVSASIILQDLSQLKALYEKEWQSIIGNCDSLVYLGGNEESTCKYISELIGKQTIRTNTFGYSRGRNGSSSKNEQQLGRELMTPDEVRALDNSKAVLLIRGESPILDQKYDLTRHPNYALTSFNPSVEHYVAPDRTAMEEAQLRRFVSSGVRVRTDFTLEQILAMPPLPIPDDFETAEWDYISDQLISNKKEG